MRSGLLRSTSVEWFMMIVAGRNEVLESDFKDELMIVDEELLLVDKCAKEDFVYFESVVFVGWWLLTPK